MAAANSRSCPAMTTSCARPAACIRIFERSGPTLTQVPVESLKSSARRPLNISPLFGIGGIDEVHRVAEPVEALVVEGRSRHRLVAPSSPA